MQNYKLNVLDKLTQFAASYHFDADDDLTALEKAKTICQSEAIEIWQSNRLVARVGTH
jgi:hypothetical protein